MAESEEKGIEKVERTRMSIIKPHFSAIVRAAEGPLEKRMEEILKNRQ